MGWGKVTFLFVRVPCAHRWGGQRSVLGAVLLVPCILLFETGSHADLKLAKQAILAGQGPGITSLPLPISGVTSKRYHPQFSYEFQGPHTFQVLSPGPCKITLKRENYFLLRVKFNPLH